MSDETNPLDPERPCSLCGHPWRIHADPTLKAGPWCAECRQPCEFREWPAGHKPSGGQVGYVGYAEDWPPPDIEITREFIGNAQDGSGSLQDSLRSDLGPGCDPTGMESLRNEIPSGQESGSDGGE